MEKINNQAEHDIMRLIRRLSKGLDEDFNSRLVTFDLTITQGRILWFIVRMKACKNTFVCQKDIQDEFDLSKSTVSELMKKLEKKGFIKKDVKEGKTYILITEKTDEMVQCFKEARGNMQKQLVKGLSKEEKETLESLINKLINNIGGNK